MRSRAAPMRACSGGGGGGGTPSGGGSEGSASDDFMNAIASDEGLEMDTVMQPASVFKMGRGNAFNFLD